MLSFVCKKPSASLLIDRLLSSHVLRDLISLSPLLNSVVFDGVSVFTESFALGVHFTSTQSNTSLKLVNIYGPCGGLDRELFTSGFLILISQIMRTDCS